jgi:hypothetical protein
MSARYLRWCAAAYFATLGLAGMLSVVVDPYGVFALVNRDGFNARKVRIAHSQFEIRSRNAERLHADAWILGNSRAEMGLDPQHPSFARAGVTAYNLAVPGETGAMSLKFAQALAQKQTPKHIILGVDFFDFLVDPNGVQAPIKPYQADKLQDYLWTLRTVFSARSTLDALRTIALQNDHFAGYLTGQGFNTMRDYVKEVQVSGAHAMFMQRAQESSKVYAQKPKSLELALGKSSKSWEALQATLAIAKPGITQVDVIIYPYHAQMRWLMAEHRLDSVFDTWRERVVRTVEAEQKSSGLAVQVWDFSGFTPVHCEPIPPAGDRKTELNWYWEAGHFKKELGDRILNIISQNGDSDPPLGLPVTSTSLPGKVALDLQNEARCRAELADTAKAVHEMVARQRAQH